MAVVDLNDVELLNDAIVKLELVVLEAGEDLSAEVHAHNVVELFLSDKITLIPFLVVLDLVHVS